MRNKNNIKSPSIYIIVALINVLCRSQYNNRGGYITGYPPPTIHRLLVQQVAAATSQPNQPTSHSQPITVQLNR